jgi:hypothetical protein
MEDTRSTYTILIVNLERRKLLRIPRRGYEDNIKIDFKEIGHEVLTDLAVGR